MTTIPDISTPTVPIRCTYRDTTGRLSPDPIAVYAFNRHEALAVARRMVPAMAEVTVILTADDAAHLFSEAFDGNIKVTEAELVLSCVETITVAVAGLTFTPDPLLGECEVTLVKGSVL
jgi:hypothetical protein